MREVYHTIRALKSKKTLIVFNTKSEYDSVLIVCIYQLGVILKKISHTHFSKHFSQDCQRRGVICTMILPKTNIQ